MKPVIYVIFLSALFAVPAAHAEGNYAGILYGQVKSEDIDTDNLGFTIGTSADKGAGFEFFYAPTLNEDEISSGSLEADITIDTYGLLAFYKTDDDVFGGYLKFKGGIAVVDLEFDFGDDGKLDDDTSGLAYGIGIGIRTGRGALELNYLVLPEFDDFRGIDVDAEVDMFSISYLWDF
ncbi:MAG: outer membrane beta-barrel protein [Gammaproteobacteria bacterium]|nr:outer membrane beta-barrel protein [Gammaproteobacteria bacterium]